MDPCSSFKPNDFAAAIFWLVVRWSLMLFCFHGALFPSVGHWWRCVYVFFFRVCSCGENFFRRLQEFTGTAVPFTHIILYTEFRSTVQDTTAVGH